MCACSDNLRLSVRCKEPPKALGAQNCKTKSCFRPYVERVRGEIRRTGETPVVLVYMHDKKGTETLSRKLDTIFNEDDEQHPDQRKVTVGSHHSNADPRMQCEPPTVTAAAACCDTQ